MKAILMREPGGPEVLTETDLPMPGIEHPTMCWCASPPLA